MKKPSKTLTAPAVIRGPRSLYTRDEKGSLRRLTLKGCKRPTARTAARNARRIAFAQAHGLTAFLTMLVPA